MNLFTLSRIITHPSKLMFLLRINSERFFDTFKGLDFLTVVESEVFGYDGNVVHHSSPTFSRDIKKVFKKLKIRPDDAIIDIGCGKGNVIRHLLKFPFKRCDGIELIGEIAKICRENFKKLGQSDRVTIYNQNCLYFDNYSKYNFFYFYNPFPCNIVEIILRKIFESVQDEPRKITILFFNYHCYKIDLIKEFDVKYISKDINGNDITIFNYQ